MTPLEQTKGALALLGIWTAWLIGHLPEIKEAVQILASIAAIVASGFYGYYYWMKIKQEKKP